VLMYAAQSGDAHLAELFLRHGADLDAEDDWYWTAMRFAQSTMFLDNSKVIDLLRAAANK
jgi:ankyrin repeat protein